LRAQAQPAAVYPEDQMEARSVDQMEDRSVDLTEDR
jgi:hypothetical protein